MKRLIAACSFIALIVPSLHAQSANDAIRAKIAALEQEIITLRAQLQPEPTAVARPTTLAEASAEAAKVKHEWGLSTNIGSSSAFTPVESSTQSGQIDAPPPPVPLGKDEAYWRGQFQILQTKLLADQHTREPLARRLAQLSSNLSPDMPSFVLFGPELTRVTTEVQRLNAIIADDQKAIDNLREDGRAAGAFPSWMR